VTATFLGPFTGFKLFFRRFQETKASYIFESYVFYLTLSTKLVAVSRVNTYLFTLTISLMPLVDSSSLTLKK